MGLFSDPNEQERKENLRKLEDKRLALAQELDKQGFKPETMLFAQTDNGGFIATASHGGQQWVILGPGFGTDEAFVVEKILLHTENLRSDRPAPQTKGS